MTRLVLVTGANRGLGRELARQLALLGDAVVLTARDLAKAERTAAALPGREPVLARRLDVTDPASIQQVAADLDRRFGRPLAGACRRRHDVAHRTARAWHGKNHQAYPISASPHQP